MRAPIAIALIVAGAVLIIMPQIHYSVVAANAAWAIAAGDLAPADVEIPALPRAMLWTSIGMGSVMIIVAMVATWRRLSAPETGVQAP